MLLFILYYLLLHYMFLIPSFYAHIFNGFLLFVAVILLIFNYSTIKKTDPYKFIN